MTGKQARTAARIEAAMQPFLRDGKDDIVILTGMNDHMTGLKDLIDTAKPGVMGELWRRYPGFYRYAKVLGGIAGAIQSGAIGATAARTEVTCASATGVAALSQALRTYVTTAATSASNRCQPKEGMASPVTARPVAPDCVPGQGIVTPLLLPKCQSGKAELDDGFVLGGREAASHPNETLCPFGELLCEARFVEAGK